ncbi:hypothetical protein, partial [Armatimonas sp.]|uniref:hypothetical protein n=1 Tax=Armatimonas sp. TaxID=1872638 RepID=UPI003753A759
GMGHPPIEIRCLDYDMKFCFNVGGENLCRVVLVYCPEDLVTGLWIDLIQQEYLRIKREENDF